jgi:hypothetical protein
VLALAQVCLAIFKLFWNSVAYRAMNRWAIKKFKINESELSFAYFSLQIASGLVNNIVIPCFIVSMINSNCFYYLFVQAPPVVSSFTFFNDFARYFQTIQTSYNPPFNYSYQCSASFITYYAPTFLYTCLLSSFLMPIIQVSIVILSRQDLIPLFIRKYILKACSKITIMPEQDKDSKPYDPTKPYVDASQLLVSMTTSLGLILTFGTMFPPLGLALFVNVVVTKYYTQLRIGRFITMTKEQFGSKYAEIIGKEVRPLCYNTLIKQSAWILIFITSWFYAFFLFDTAGNETTVTGAYWTLILMGLFPILLYSLFKLIKSVSENINEGNHIKADALSEYQVLTKIVFLLLSIFVNPPISLFKQLCNSAFLSHVILFVYRKHKTAF